MSTTANSFTTKDVFVSSNASSGLTVATWIDEGNNNYPTYSFYDSTTGWSEFGTITTSSAGVAPGNVMTSQDPGSGIILATWTESTTNRPMSSLYVPGSGWGTATPAATGSSALQSTINSYNPVTGQFIVAWADSQNHNYPTVATFKRGTGFGSPQVIATTSKSVNIYASFMTTNNQVLAVWVDSDTGSPMYSVYSTSWSTPAAFGSPGVDNDVQVSCDPTTSKCLAVWADNSISYYATYAVYTPGSGWSASNSITTSSSVQGSVGISVDSTTGQFLATWSAFQPNSNAPTQPTYAFYTSSGGWTTPAALSDSAVTNANIFTSFDPVDGQFLAVWSDAAAPDVTYHPTYVVFNMCISNTAID